MQNYRNNYQDLMGNAITGASVTVRLYPSNVLATIYSDNGITPIPNPTTTDLTGEFNFYAANGNYTVILSKQNYATQTFANVLLYDPADAIPGTFTSLAVSGNATIGGTLSVNGSATLYSASYTSVVNSTSPATGSIVTAGGLGVALDIYCGGSYHGAAFITSGTINSTPIGATTPSSIVATTFSATSVSSTSVSASTVSATTSIAAPAINAATSMTTGTLAATTTNSTSTITVSDTGASGANLKLVGNGASTPSKTLRANTGSFQVVNDAYSSAILTLTDTGSMSIPGTLSVSQTGGIVGTNTNNNAAAGSVGEFVSSVVAQGSAVPLTNGVAANVTSISLTAGDWDVNGNVNFVPAGTTITVQVSGSISTTSATQALQPSVLTTSATAGTGNAFSVPRVRLSLAATTTVYLVATASFSTSTMGVFGTISARRAR